MPPLFQQLHYLLSQAEPASVHERQLLIFKKQPEATPGSPPEKQKDTDLSAFLGTEKIPDMVVLLLIRENDPVFCQELKQFLNCQDWIEAKNIPPANALEALSLLSNREKNTSARHSQAPPAEVKNRQRSSSDTSVAIAKETFLKPENIFLQCTNQEIEQHLDDESFRPACLAKAFSICEMQLHRRLKQMAGLSPANYIRKYRLHRSCQFLRDHSLNITESGFMAGFRSLEYFSRSFKKEFGVSPSIYRELCEDAGQGSKDFLANSRMLK